MYKSIFFLTSALVGVECSSSRPGRFTPGERAPGMHWIEGYVEHRATLHSMEKRKFLTLPGLELRPLGRPARSRSLYRLRYSGSQIITYNHIFTNILVIKVKLYSTVWEMGYQYVIKNARERSKR
jgi:hypothetical protein